MIRLALAGLRHYWKLSLMLGLGVFLAAAVLTGSLLVGDSVKATLRAAAAERVGGIESALVGADRFFTADLADQAGAAPVLFVPGTVSTPDKKKRANGVWIYGVDERFWKLAGVERPEGDYFAMGEPLFERLGIQKGERVNARMELPGRVSRDAPLSGETEKTASLAGEVSHVIPSSQLGRFSLLAEQSPALNVFVPLASLQEKLQKGGRANLLLGGAAPDAWSLADAELKFRGLPSGGVELISDRVFVSEATSSVVQEIAPGSEGVLSYLINQFEAGGATVPYSVAAGIGPNASKTLAGKVLADDEVLVNAWMAGPPEEGGLGVKEGDRLTMRYFEVDDSREFVERSRAFAVVGVVPMDHPAMADGWVPEFPGLETADSLADWESGMPLDTQLIQGQDEKYWDDYRATPKAFIAHSAAREMWGNRFGNVTALRFAAGNPAEEEFVNKLRQRLSLTDLGMSIRAPKAEAEAAVAGALDFGALFGSLSGFLIISALLLVAMLCTFGMEARASQIGLMGALGFRRFEVRKLFMWEGSLVAFIAAVLGAFAGVLYTKVALWALGSVWRGASVGMQFHFEAKPISIVVGAVATFVMAKLTLWLAGRRITAVAPRALLAGDITSDDTQGRHGKRPKVLLGVGLVGGLVAIAAGFGLEGEKLAGAFFGAGFAFLLAGLAAFALLLRKLEHGVEGVDLAALGRRNAVRRRGRSISVAAMVASGVFLVAAVNAFRLKTDDDPNRRDTGTGGFDYIGTATLPIYEDLNDPEVRDKFGLEDFTQDDLKFVRFRVRSDGEEASCLNLNHSARPRVIAVDAEELASRKAFRFASVDKSLPHGDSAWWMLDHPFDDGSVPAIGDKASVMWALKKKLGDTVAYPDGLGGEVLLRIVGLLENSVLQGNLVIGEEAFKTHFPSDGGYEMFLVDVDNEKSTAVIEEVTKRLDQRGVAFEGARERLAAYAQVQNTYISIFSVLGGLGVLLGTVGVGLVIARNVLERRAEIGVMSALGFRRKALVKMVLSEHLMLVVAGVLIGTVAALAAVAPNLVGRAAGFPLVTVGVMVLAIAAGGLLFCVLAARLALRGSLLDAIRSE